MSIDQQALTDFEAAPEDDGEDEPPSWQPMVQEDTQCACDVCGNAVSRRFKRVFGDNNDELQYGCLECSTLRDISVTNNRNGGSLAFQGVVDNDV